jgi:predicted GNAT superfamily acetyltransferase
MCLIRLYTADEHNMMNNTTWGELPFRMLNATLNFGKIGAVVARGLDFHR